MSRVKNARHSQQTSADRYAVCLRQNNSADLSRHRQRLMQRGYVRKTQQTSADNSACRLHAKKLIRPKHTFMHKPYVRKTRPDRPDTYAQRLRAKHSSDISRHLCTSARYRKHGRLKQTLLQDRSVSRITIASENIENIIHCLAID